jgi:hypothetical protein
MFDFAYLCIATLILFIIKYGEIKFSILYCSAELIFMHLTPRKKVVWINLVTTSKQIKKTLLMYTHSALPPFLAFYMADTGGKNIRVILENRCYKANQQKKDF